MKTSLTKALYECSVGLKKARGSRVPHKRAKESFGKFEIALRSVPEISSSSFLSIQSGYGMGGFADVPWIALRDKRASDNATEGFYIVFLFSKDGSRIYLTLIVAADGGPGRQFRAADYEIIASKAKQLTLQCEGLLDQKYFPNERMDLGSTGALPRSYLAGTAAFRSYLVKELERSAKDLVMADLSAFLRCYETLVSSGVSLAASSFASTGSVGNANPFTLSQLAILSNHLSQLGYEFD